ncbi:MAG: ATP-binding cassette domain-containing protein [Arhodomonas sp.]|nr:ATP-binding cassette domain-containing protein [Arhodomonas sp.]
MSFDVAEGGVMALLGRNGAGKTSTLRTIARAHEPALRQGEIHLAGQALHRCNANQAARAGVQLVPEDRRIIPGITVEENLIVAQVAPRTRLAAGGDLRALPPARRAPPPGRRHPLRR